MTSLTAIDQHLAALSLYPVLTPEEEIEIATAAHNGDAAAREKLIKHNMRFVVKVAKKYRGHGVSFDDLIEEGNLGLVRAADRYEPDRQVRFISYAIWWIRQAILLALACQGRALTLPASRASDLYRLRKAEDEMKTVLGRPATDAEIGERLSLSAEVVSALRAAHEAPVVELDEDPPAGEATPARDKIPLSEEHGDIEHNLNVRLTSAFLGRELDKLPERDANILRLYYGLSGGRALTLEEIAQVMGVTRERVRQLRDRGLAALKLAARSGEVDSDDLDAE